MERGWKGKHESHGILRWQEHLMWKGVAEAGLEKWVRQNSERFEKGEEC